MVHYCIYAKDYSISTDESLKTLEQFKSDVDKIKEEFSAEESTQSKVIYLLWGNDCHEVDEIEVRKRNDGLGCEQTVKQPEKIIEYLKNKYICDENDKVKLLYIITDGGISNDCAKKCIDLNNSMHYETVVFHAFNEDTEKNNLSVAAPFFKQRCIVYRNNELCEDADISKEFDYDEINNDNFEAEKNVLKSYIRLKFINKFKSDVVSRQEIQKLAKLCDRLVLDLISKKPKCPYFDSGYTEKERKIAILKFSISKFENDYRAVHKIQLNVEKSFATLMEYIKSQEKSYSFDALKLDQEVDEPKEDLFDDDDLSDCEELKLIECFDDILDDT